MLLNRFTKKYGPYDEEDKQDLKRKIKRYEANTNGWVDIEEGEAAEIQKAYDEYKGEMQSQ